MDKKIKADSAKKHALYRFLVLSFCLALSSPAFGAEWSPKDVLKRYMVNNYPWEDVQISHIKVMGKTPDVLPEKITVEKGPIGKAVFYFWFKDSRRVAVRASIDALDWVVKSKRPFSKGHIIAPDDVYVSKISIRKMPRSAVLNPRSIIGKSLKRSITANIPIVDNMIEKARSVRKGARVVLLVDHNGLNITAAGKTREKGYVGMAVRAINLDSKREVRGILIDENTIKVRI